MRAFIVLALVAAANAGLLPTTGYAYGVGHQSGPIVSTSVAYGNALLPVNADLTGAGGQLVTGGTTVLGLNALDSIPQSVEYSKQFYHFTAPEEEHHEGVINQQLSNTLKKNLQVVFIKAPENNAATNAAVQIAKQAIEQKTAIYVLSKENDASQVVNQLQQIQENVQTTPEVGIIKYRTQQDIDVAKNTIQSQYNNYGGASLNIDGGVAPVIDYSSKVANVNYVSGGPIVQGLTTGGLSGSTLVSTGNLVGGNSIIANNNYLPPVPIK